MRKYIIILFTMLCYTALALAVPAKPGWHTMTQSDGTTLKIQAVGNAFNNALLTTDGLAVERGADGDFYYISSLTGLTAMRAHNPEQRTATEKAFVAAQRSHLGMTHKSYKMPNAKGKLGATGSNATADVPALGERRIPIILVEFQDKKFNHTPDQIIESMLTGHESVGQYFHDQSNGMYKPVFDVYGIYSLSQDREYYGGRTSSTKDKGEAQASGYHPEAIWPCNWTLDAAKYYSRGGNGAFSPNVGDPYVNHFAVFNELHGSNDNGKSIDGIGTFVHEFGHCLGLPDLYDTGNNDNYGMGNWDVMCLGCYANDSYSPVGYSAYEKVFMGWVNYITPEPNTYYTLPAWNQKTRESDKAVCIVSDVNKNEYFIFENRQRTGWDRSLPGTGILVTHITYSPSYWTNNKPNNDKIQLVTLLPADNKLSKYSESGDTWPQYGRTALTDETSPATVLNMDQMGNITGKAGYLGKPVTEMVINKDGTASFWYMKEEHNYAIGDVNHDGDVNIADVTALIDMLLGNGNATCTLCADVNGDSEINIADVTALIDKLLN